MNLAKYDLNLLITLHALLLERNVTRAAKRLGVSQPAVSGALAKLRANFDDALLVRVGRQLELTPFAQQLLEPLEQTLSALEQVLARRETFEPATEKRSFRIACRDYLAFLLIPRLVTMLQAQAPGISVCFSPLDASALDMLASDKLDFLLLPQGYQQQFPAVPLFVEPWVCALWAQHPDVGDEISLAQYLQLDHLIFMPGPGKRVAARPMVSDTDVQRHALVSIESLALMPFLLANTTMVALVPKRMAEAAAHMADIKILQPPHQVAPIRQTLCWNPRRSNDPAHQWMQQQIIAAARQL